MGTSATFSPHSPDLRDRCDMHSPRLQRSIKLSDCVSFVQVAQKAADKAKKDGAEKEAADTKEEPGVKKVMPAVVYRQHRKQY